MAKGSKTSTAGETPPGGKNPDRVAQGKRLAEMNAARRAAAATGESGALGGEGGTATLPLQGKTVTRTKSNAPAMDLSKPPVSGIPLGDSVNREETRVTAELYLIWSGLYQQAAYNFSQAATLLIGGSNASAEVHSRAGTQFIHQAQMMGALGGKRT